MSDNLTSLAAREILSLSHKTRREYIPEMHHVVGIIKKYKKMEEALKYAKGDRHGDHCDDVNDGICNCKIEEIQEALDFDPLSE